MSEGLSSDQLLDVLLAKISGQPLEEVALQNSFQGQVREGEREVGNRSRRWLCGYRHVQSGVGSAGT